MADGYRVSSQRLNVHPCPCSPSIPPIQPTPKRPLNPHIQAAQEMFNKSFDECEPHERVRVGGKVGRL